MLLWGVVRSTSIGKEPEYAYSDLNKVVNNQVKDASIQGDELKGHLKVSPKTSSIQRCRPTRKTS